MHLSNDDDAAGVTFTPRSLLTTEDGIPTETTSLLPERHGKLRPLSAKEARIAWWQVAILCWSLFLIGWGDGTVGPLIPRIQSEFSVDFVQVSYIFVTGCAGAVLGQIGNMPLTDRLGFGPVLFIGCALEALSYAGQGVRLEYPAFLMWQFVGKFGVSIVDAQANTFIATLSRNAETKMGFLHAAYGFGALVAPLSATYFSQVPRWQDHFIFSSLLALSNTVLAWVIFGFKTQDACLLEAGEVVAEKTDDDAQESKDKYRQLIRLPEVHLLALFIIVYVGVEMTIGGWIVSFMLLVRDGGPSSGYVATGFFGGLTLGRIVLLPVNRWLGTSRAIYIYSFLAIFFQLVVWLVPSFSVGAIAVTIVGLLLGPMYPMIINHTANTIPRQLVAGAIGWIGASGAAGATVLPYFTGLLAEAYGIAALQPFGVATTGVLVVIWKYVKKTPVSS